MEIQSSFGEWLRARRKALDLTQFDLAERVGCAEDTIGRIEAGSRRPSKQVAALLAEALGVPPHSHAEFIHFAREGGPAGGLERIPSHGATSAPGGQPQQPTFPTPPTHAASLQPAAWVPYLSSLPQPLTPLFGREAELAATAALLSSRQARLLTLTGPPGVGKTRLALAVASSLTPSFPDGICFVPLAPLRDAGLLVATVAHALGLSDQGVPLGSAVGPQASRLLEFLRHKHLLLVLDNFEHILAATPLVAEWLSASVHLQALVTSRSALNLRGERLFPVSTLAVPPNPSLKSLKSLNHSPEPHLAQLHAYPSVSLCVERVQALDPFFRLTTSNSHAVAELCTRMEGLPLAIELTAARSARLAPELVLAGLEQGSRRMERSAIPGQGSRRQPGRETVGRGHRQYRASRPTAAPANAAHGN